MTHKQTKYAATIPARSNASRCFSNGYYIQICFYKVDSHFKLHNLYNVLHNLFYGLK